MYIYSSKVFVKSMKNRIKKKNNILDSMLKVDKHLRAQKNYVSPTSISASLHLHSRSINSIIRALVKVNRVSCITNGKTTLLKFRGIRKSKK
jgi:hypothetical protein